MCRQIFMSEKIKKLSEQEYKERFDKLYNMLSNTHLEFYVWKGLQQKEYEDIYGKNKYFWNTVLSSSQNAWLMNIARLYEESRFSHKGQVISIQALLPHCPNKENVKKVEEILESRPVIENLKILRNKQLAHNDAEYLLDSKKIHPNLSIKYGDIEDLLEKSKEILHLMHPDGDGFLFKPLEESSEEDSKLLIEKLQYYEDQRQVHMEKFRKGEIDNPRFPPEN